MFKEVDSPKFIFNSESDKQLLLEGSVEVQDAYGTKQSYPVKAELNRGDTMLTLPGDYSKQGIWYGKYEFRFIGQTEGGLTGNFRFGRMTPVGPTPGNPAGFIFGVNAHPASYTPNEVSRMAELAALAGFKVIRTDTSWHDFERVQGKIIFSLTDLWIKEFKKQHIKMFWVSHNPPSWAVDPESRGLYPGKKPNRPKYDAYRSFISRFIERYQENTAFFETWNEPDLGFANFSVDEYLKLQHIAHETVKSINSAITVTTGGFGYTWAEHYGWKPHIISRHFKEGRNDFDVLSFHGHGKFTLYEAWINDLKKIGAISPGKWIAGETALSAYPNGELDQARGMFTKVIYTMAEQAVGYIWYNLREKWYHPILAERAFGLVNSDLTPKAVYIAYTALIRNFQDAKLEKSFNLGKGMHVYGFRRENGEILFPAWSVHEDERVLLISGVDGKVEDIDLFGNTTERPYNSGKILWKIGQTPSLLKITGQKGAININTLVKAKNIVSIIPGETATLNLNLFNPATIAEPFTLRYHTSVPELAVSGPGKMIVPPEIEKISAVKLKVGKAFCSNTTQTIHCEIGYGKMSETISVPVKSAWLMSYGSYRQEPSIRLNSDGQILKRAPYGAEFSGMEWNGPDDLSALVFTKYDRQAMYVKIVVTDDIHSQPNAANSGINGDGVQLAFALPGQKSPHWEFLLIRRDNGMSETSCTLTPVDFSSGVAKQLKLVTSRDEKIKQTIYEVEIPWKAIGVDRPTQLKQLRMSLVVNDCDDGKTVENSLLSSDGIIGTKEYKYIDNFPVVRLTPGK